MIIYRLIFHVLQESIDCLHILIFHAEMQRWLPLEIFKKRDLIGALFLTINASNFLIEIFDLPWIVVDIVKSSFSLGKNVENKLPENIVLHLTDLVFIVFIP